MAIDPIQKFYAVKGYYPGNNKQWWVARADIDDPDTGVKAGDFLPEILDKIFYGNNRAPTGHYILEAFRKDRTYASGVQGLPVETIAERPNTISFFSGRVWYGCNNTVYFSQIMNAKNKVGKCFQEADPTSEIISDLIVSDGGEIPIPEIVSITKLLPNAGGVLVFATNGVWFISGTDAGFSARDITVSKVSPIGCSAPRSIINTDKGVFYWSDTGITGIAQSMGQYGPVSGVFDNTNISESTIQDFYNSIPDQYKTNVTAAYDPKSSTIYWMYQEDNLLEHSYNRILCFDLSLGAFYPWKFSSIENGPRIKSLYVAERQNTIDFETDVDPSQIEYLTVDGTQVRIAQVRSNSFVDWKGVDGTGAPYDSYLETGYELFNDAMRKKNITYLFTYLKRTETEADSEGILDRPSSCYLTVKFDWSSGAHANKWTTPVQVYRPGRLLFDPDTGFGLVTTKNRIRGNGKSIQFRFGTDEPGKDFDLHGWSVAVSGNTTP